MEPYDRMNTLNFRACLFSLFLHGLVLAGLSLVRPMGIPVHTDLISIMTVSVETAQGMGHERILQKKPAKHTKPGVDRASGMKSQAVHEPVRSATPHEPDDTTSESIAQVRVPAEHGEVPLGARSDAGGGDASIEKTSASPGLKQDTNSRPEGTGSGSGEGPVSKAYPLYRVNPPPEYPESARLRGLEGTVTLMVLVDRSGRVKDMNLKDTSGYPVLDRAAGKTVKNWLFEPGKTGNRPMDMWVIIPVTFRIRT